MTRALAAVALIAGLAASAGGGRRVGGKVVDPEGAPVKGAEVLVFFDERGSDLVETDEAGVFSVKVPRSGAGYSKFDVTAKGFVPLKRTTFTPGETIKLVRQVRVTGRVVGDDGAPVGGVRAHFKSTRAESFPVACTDFPQSAMTDADGRFDATDLPPGELDVQIDAAAYALYRGHVTAPSTDVTFVLKRGLRVSGTVVDSEGKPVAAIVDVQPTNGDRILRVWVPRSKQSDGSFVVGGLGEGEYEVRVEDEREKVLAKERVQLRGDAKVTLTLPPNALKPIKVPVRKH